MPKPTSNQLASILRESLGKGQEAQLVVTSNSMAPILKTGDAIKLSSTSTSALQPGDLITFKLDDHLLTHRLWKIQGDSENQLLLTRGDRPLRFDPVFSAEDVVGLVIGRQRQNRYLSFNNSLGKWLNRHLAWLVGKESGWLEKNGRWQGRRISWWAIGFHRAVYMWATAVTTIIGFLGSVRT